MIETLKYKMINHFRHFFPLKFQILQTVKSQPMGSFPSRWLVMSHSVSITTHSQHLSLKSLCGSLTIQGVSVGN